MPLPDPPAWIYIVGPMSGKPDLNREAFAEVERELLGAGYWPLSPRGQVVGDQVEQQERGVSAAAQTRSKAYRDGMRRNTQWLVNLHEMAPTHAVDAAEPAYVGGLILLPGWERSGGSRYDVLTGQLLQLPIVEWPNLNPPRFKVVTLTRDEEPSRHAIERPPGHHCLRSASGEG